MNRFNALCLSLVIISAIACAAQRPAAYAAELEACLQVSADCAHYVDCRRTVAAKYDRVYDGSCLVAAVADAGSDGGAK